MDLINPLTQKCKYQASKLKFQNTKILFMYVLLICVRGAIHLKVLFRPFRLLFFIGTINNAIQILKFSLPKLRLCSKEVTFPIFIYFFSSQDIIIDVCASLNVNFCSSETRHQLLDLFL